ncbi:MAG TPA: septum formation family protein [Jatrophihabitans sp.]|nr:septum formation family protein [Jatrophihabitans sp.]
MTEPNSEAGWQRHPSSVDRDAWMADQPAAPPDGSWSAPPGTPATYQGPAPQPAPYPQAAYGVSAQNPYGAQPYPPTPAGWTPGPPYGGAQPARRRDGWSVAALVCGILPTVPIGVALGVVGLVRTGNPLRRGRWMALTGLLLSLGWLVIAALVIPLVVDLAGGPSGHPQAQRAVSTVDPGRSNLTVTISPKDLRPGDCFTMPATGTLVATLEIVPCGQLHDAQDVANVHLPDASFPGQAAVQREALADCTPRTLAYLGGNADNVRLWSFFPTAQVWAMGNHVAHCVAWDSRSKFVGDVRDHH